MKHNISPYPEGVKVNTAGHVFDNGKYLGYVDRVLNWGTDFLSRVERDAKLNKFFSTKTEAVLYILSTNKP